MTGIPLTAGSLPAYGSVEDGFTGAPLIKRFSFKSQNDNDNDHQHDHDDDDDDDDEPKTTPMQTFVHLFKGYLGAGCLSLPWAISQLGMIGGPLAIIIISIWSSYNCWTVVRLKRYVERKTNYMDDKMSETSSVTTNTNVTYPDVGDWAYGANFQTYVTASVCTQQLAICTVFISFVGENILAILQSLDIDFLLSTHAGVMTMVLPFILLLSFVPNLKLLAPVMATGTMLLMTSFVGIGIIIVKEWHARPTELPQFDAISAPLAVCAILYSYEGINLVLPVESAMKDPSGFKPMFVWAMAGNAFILVFFSVICVVTFGYVDNGSVTAFLLEAYKDDPSITLWLMIANAAVSLSVLVTYPLQLFPALELLAPRLSRYMPFGGDNKLPSDNDNDDDDDLSAFEPLPPLPEDGVADDWDGDFGTTMEHQYDVSSPTNDHVENGDNDDNIDGNETTSMSRSAITSIKTMLPKMTMSGDSLQVRTTLVIMTYLVAVIVPNVQALISLAGAVAGTSSALLIPPFLDLAFINKMEVDLTIDDDVKNEGTASSSSFLLPWTAAGTTTVAAGGGGTVRIFFGSGTAGKYWFEKIKCYILIGLGLVSFVVGTVAALADIVRIYRSG